MRLNAGSLRLRPSDRSRGGAHREGETSPRSSGIGVPPGRCKVGCRPTAQHPIRPASWVEQVFDTMFDTAFVLLVIAALLVVVGFCQPLAARLKLPPPVLLGVVGVAVGGFPAILSRLRLSGAAPPLPRH